MVSTEIYLEIRIIVLASPIYRERGTKMDRKITNKVAGYQTVDGAGVSLVRVLGMGTMDKFDPIL